MAYISLQVADLGICSVIMQGFNFEKLNTILAQKGYIDNVTEAVHISIAIGYPTKKRKKMFIHNFEFHYMNIQK